MTQSQTGYWLGLGASVLVAIAGQAEILPEPWRHIVAILGIVGTAVGIGAALSTSTFGSSRPISSCRNASTP